MSRQLLSCALLLALGASLDTEGGTWTRSEPFAFGIEYMAPGLARTYAATGAFWAKGTPAGFDWNTIEPKPPVGGKHAYDWTIPDTLVREYQEAGFRHLHIYTQARSAWAGVKALPLVGHPSLMPRRERLADYAEYLRQMVERYDGDGVADMPGLRFPIRHWEIEAEWGTFWHGTLDEYLELLRIAHKTVKQADPNAQVILQGLLFMGIFDGDASLPQLERLKASPIHRAKIEQGLRDIPQLLKHHELFDIVEFHSLGDWTEVANTARYLREQMAKLGYQKPIWAGDVNFNLNPMLWHGQPYYPYVAAQKEAIHGWLVAMRDARHPRHAQALQWFRAEQASFTAKKLLCAFGEGLAGINMGNLEDWPLFAVLPGISGTGGFCGLIDLAGTERRPPGLPPGFARRIPGQPRPAYWTLKLLIGKLGPYMAVTPLDLGKGIHAYRFHQPRPPTHRPRAIVAAWHEDGKGQLPGDPEPSIQAALPAAARSAAIVPIITAIGQADPKPRPAEIRNGTIHLTLTETPVLIEELE